MSALLKTYEPPELKDFGKVVELTQGRGGSFLGARRQASRARSQARRQVSRARSQARRQVSRARSRVWWRG